MAKCKYCHENISRLDKEVCPFCGGVRPLEGTDTSTQDVTKVINTVGTDNVKIKHKKRIIAAILAATLGIFGMQHIYLGKYKKALLFSSLCFSYIGLLGLFDYFVVGLKNIWAFLIPYFLVQGFLFYVAFVFLTNHSIQDAHGEFLE